MKNKKLVYILFPLVLFVWGMIFYKILAGNNPSSVENNIERKHDKIKTEPAKDTIAIIADYRDPFLDGDELVENSEEPTGQNLSYTPPPVPPIPKQSPNFPEIKYFGVITNAVNKQKRIGIFRIAGKDCILKEGELSSNFKILKLFNDSAKVVFQEVKKTIKKG